MKNSIKSLMIMSSLVTTSYAANPPTDCEPLISEAEWVKSPNIIRVDLDPAGRILKTIFSFLPGDVEPYTYGSIEVANYSKTGCCSKDDDEPKILEKDEITGTGGVGVDSGRLPIPGLALPFGAGGAYIGASTGIEITLSGSAQDTCISESELCASATISQPISLYGGVNFAGDTLDIRLNGSGTISGTVEWCENTGLDVGDLCGGASATLSITSFSLTVWEKEIFNESTCD